MALAISDPSPPTCPPCQPQFTFLKPPGACIPGLGACWKRAGVQLFPTAPLASPCAQAGGWGGCPVGGTSSHAAWGRAGAEGTR